MFLESGWSAASIRSARIWCIRSAASMRSARIWYIWSALVLIIVISLVSIIYIEHQPRDAVRRLYGTSATQQPHSERTPKAKQSHTNWHIVEVLLANGLMKDRGKAEKEVEIRITERDNTVNTRKRRNDRMGNKWRKTYPITEQEDYHLPP